MKSDPGRDRSAVVSFDIGGTNIRLALVSSDGAIISRKHFRTAGTLELFFDQLCTGVSGLSAEADASGFIVTAVGGGMPGLISPSGEIFSSVNLKWCEGVNLASEVSRLTGFSTYIGNDANVAACGEHRFGAGRKFRSLLMITIGTGVGGGVILNNSLWCGSEGFAGEFGHLTIYPDGRKCLCGNHGCVETYASATAIVASALEDGRWGRENVTASSLSILADSGDRAAAALFEDAGRVLGIAAASVVNLLNIQGVIVGGGVAESFHLLKEKMEFEMRRRAFPHSVSCVEILKGELGDDAGILGGAALAFSQGG